MSNSKNINSKNIALAPSQDHADAQALATHIVNIARIKSSRTTAKEATSRAVEALLTFMREHSLFEEFLQSTRPKHVLTLRISAISNWYYRYKFRQLSSINAVDKKELIALAKHYEKLINKLEALSPVTRLYVFTDFFEQDKEAMDPFAKTRATLEGDLEIIRRLIAKSRGRGSLEISHIKEVVEIAARLFTRCSRRRFKINWTAVGPNRNEFVALDSLFVETLLKAIDPEITFANVRTALREIPVQDEVRIHQSTDSE